MPAKNITKDSLPTLVNDLLKAPTDITTRIQGAAVVIAGSGGEDHKEWRLWLWWQMKRTCYYFKSLYEYEAWVTQGPDPGSPRHAVDKLEVMIMRDADHANYVHSCTGTDYCAKSDEVWATGGACGRTCCGAIATYQGVRWAAPAQCMD